MEKFIKSEVEGDKQTNGTGSELFSLKREINTY